MVVTRAIAETKVKHPLESVFIGFGDTHNPHIPDFSLQGCILESHIISDFSILYNLYIHDKISIEMREFLEKGLEMFIWILHIINRAHLSNAMHWQLRCTYINSANTYATRKDRADCWTTGRVIAHHKVLHQYITL